MDNEQKMKLIKSQQGELDAVILYRKLANIIKNEEYKEKFLKVASDEGKHASILKEYTNEILKPKSLKANIVAMIYRVLGAKYTMNMLAKGELKSVGPYSELVKDFPRIQEIIDDELRHAKIAEEYKNTLI